MIDLLTDEQAEKALAYTRFDKPIKEVGVFDGALSSPFVGAKHAMDVGAAALSDMAMPTIEKIAPEFISDYFRAEQSKAYQSLRDTRPDPSNMGQVAQVGHALGSVMTMGLAGGLVGGPAGAVVAIGSGSGYDKYKELREQHVDEETALKVSGLTGAVMGIGAALPAFMGKTLTTQILSGIGMNVPLGMAERGGTSAVLDESGYHQMAQHYKMIDGMAMTIDAVLGAAFPIGARAFRKPVPPGEVDAAMDANRGVVERTRDPVIPSSLESADKIRSANDEVARQIIEEGRPPHEVEVPRGLYDDAVANPKLADEIIFTAKETDGHFKEEGYKSFKEAEGTVDVMSRAYREAFDEISNRPVDDIKPVGEWSKEASVAAAEAEYEATYAKSIIKENEGMVVSDDNGNAVKASDLMSRAEADYQQAKKEIKLYEVAVACAMEVGE